MTVTLALDPQEEAKLVAMARARGLSTDELLREVVEGILAGASAVPNGRACSALMGSELVAAMQASPYKELDLEAARDPVPTRKVEF